MGCSIKKDAQCLMSTNDIDLTPTSCTMDYTPVCGSVAVQCIKAPCPAVEQTFSNLCMLKANPVVTLVHTGECAFDIML